MPAQILEKFGPLTSLNITMTGLAGSASQSGRASDFVDNTSDRAGKAIIFVRMQLDATVSGSKSATIYGLRRDGANVSGSDNITGNAFVGFLNAPVIGMLGNRSSPGTNDIVTDAFIFNDLGPYWGIGVSHDMASKLTMNTGDNYIRYQYIWPEGQ